MNSRRLIPSTSPSLSPIFSTVRLGRPDNPQRTAFCWDEAARYRRPFPLPWETPRYSAPSPILTAWKSKEWTDLAPERDKALKTIRRYAIEAVQ
jgi:hypothetical protein